MTVCEKGQCTACGACANICPRDCITFPEDKLGDTVAVINEAACTHCGLCSLVCPRIAEVKGNAPQKCFAAWSLNEEIRRKSASGGIAAEVYRLTAQRGGKFAGVKLTEQAQARFFLTDCVSEIKAFQNSKYVFSETGDIFRQIQTALRQGWTVTLIGLPCQVAGLKQYLSVGKQDMSHLLLVDLVCHGTTPTKYLQQHIQALECRCHHHATEISFRDPDAYTYTYTFTLRENGNLFYKRKVYRNDVYQIGYHAGITYRENCYHCAFACPQRQGDITLADFSGVGMKAPCSHDNKNVSCILVNTKKGNQIVQELQNRGQIYLEERPLAEEMDTERQLNTPTPVPAERNQFLAEYEKTGDFEHSMRVTAWKQIAKNELRHYLQLDKIRRAISHAVPSGLKESVRRIRKG